MSFRCGVLTLLGRPNVGKSTLLNHLVGQKISITSRKPQTTRDRILGIKNRDDGQLLIVDTPGVHFGGKRLINRHMMRTAENALTDVDLVVWMVEAGHWSSEDGRVAKMLGNLSVPVVGVVNKVDKIKNRADLLPFLEKFSSQKDFVAVVPISARVQKDVERLEDVLLAQLPEGEAYFSEEEMTDRPLRFIFAEFVREQVFRMLGEEVPYATAVELEGFKEEDGLVHVDAVIYVERRGQKAILIGKGGERMKRIGQGARRNMENLVGKKVFLRLWVKVKDEWTENPKMLFQLGYDAS